MKQNMFKARVYLYTVRARPASNCWSRPRVVTCLRLWNNMHTITRYKFDMAEQKDEVCHMYIWEKRSRCPWYHKTEHAAFGTPAGTYISIHPAYIQSFRPNPVMIKHSLKEDIEDKQQPNHIIPLIGLKTKDIDEWYKTLDKTNGEFEELTKDYSALATALSKGSDFFKTFLTGHKTKVVPNMIVDEAERYTKTKIQTRKGLN
ncbi:uncharacterized protein LOC128241653 [Mya arenaria]|uniref:uncharacterized protein LOC128241653 n=1 Tax=Mya arenaria TaxID=6604 RepID=UPI0022E38FF1|nr:uncharacterized protein LOC128241653 [Mya arenaria]